MIKATLLTFLLVFSASLSFAVSDKTTQKNTPYPEMTKEMRTKMADMHQQMAVCLKSEKSFEHCHTDIHAGCQEFGRMMPMMKGDGHSMMGDGHGAVMKKSAGMMGGYPGMMTGFCGDKWHQTVDPQKTKTK